MRAIHGVMAKRRACHSAGTVAEAKKRKRQLVTKLREGVDEAGNILARLAQEPHLLHSKTVFAPPYCEPESHTGLFEPNRKSN